MGIFLFLEIRREMADFERLLEQHRLGISLPFTVKRYQNVDERINTLVNDFDFNGVLLFLQYITHNIKNATLFIGMYLHLQYFVVGLPTIFCIILL